MAHRRARKRKKRTPYQRLTKRKKRAISRKIRYLVKREGRSVAQAAAIAYRMAGVARPRTKKGRRVSSKTLASLGLR